LADFDSLTDTFTERILNTDNREKSHVLEDILEHDLVVITLGAAGILRWPLLKVSVGETNSA
jgi:hypothetical protein